MTTPCPTCPAGSDTPATAPPPGTPVVDRCCCMNIRFRDLKRIADTTGSPLEVVARQAGCGTGCGLCAPYLRVMLRTGQTEIPLMAPDDLRAMAEHEQPAPADRP